MDMSDMKGMNGLGDMNGDYGRMMERVYKMMELAKANGMGGMGDPENTGGEPADAGGEDFTRSAKKASSTVPPPIPPLFGDIPDTNEMKAIKSAIPYVDARHRKTLAIWAKLLEIRRLTDTFDSQAMARFGCDAGSESDRRRGMLNAMRPFVPPDKARIIDFIVKAMDMRITGL